MAIRLFMTIVIRALHLPVDGLISKQGLGCRTRQMFCVWEGQSLFRNIGDGILCILANG